MQHIVLVLWMYFVLSQSLTDNAFNGKWMFASKILVSYNEIVVAEESSTPCGTKWKPNYQLITFPVLIQKVAEHL